MALSDVLAAQARWQPLASDSPLYDARLRVYECVVPYWDQPFTASPAHWDARLAPDYDPLQMMAMGVFGDAYWGDPLGRERMAMLPQNKPFTRGPRHYTNTRGVQCRDINYHGRPASLKREWWLDRGIICDFDPLGWFEWFCWYWLGRRIDKYDAWQVQRWVDFKTRQSVMYWHRPSAGTAQALLHWGIRVPH